VSKKTFRPYDPDQMLLLPPSVRDWVPDGDMAHFVSDLVDTLDLSAIENKYEQELRGYPPYHPRMMTKLWLYGYATGVFSSRRLARLARRDVGVLMLAAGNEPDFRTLNEFRKTHLAQLAGLFTQVVLLCEKKGLVKLRHVAIDGTKVKANASKHSAMSYGRMKPELDRIETEIKAWFKESDRVDDDEDALFGPDKRGDELPPELQTAARRKDAIRKAMAELEQEARDEAAEKARTKGRKKGQSESEIEQAAAEASAEAVPKTKAQRNFTDSESRIMKGGDGSFIQGYNAQAAVDASSQVIVAHSLGNSAADSPQLVPVTDEIENVVGIHPQQVSADAGYCSESNLEEMESRCIDAYIATGRMPRSYRMQSAPTGRIPSGLTKRERMKRKLTTQRGRRVYKQRQQVVEPVFGQIKNKGLIRFLLRGLENVSHEWGLHAIGHNLCKLRPAW
jgi:transposase